MQETTGQNPDTALKEQVGCTELPQMRKLKSFGDRIGRLGANFAVFDVRGNPVLLRQDGRFQSNCYQLADFCFQALQNSLKHKGTEAENCVQRFGLRREVLAVVLKIDDTDAGAALIDLGDTPLDIRSDLFGNMLELLAQDFQSGTTAEKQIDIISTELAQVYEELVLLHKLSTSMKVTEPDANFLQMACDNLTDIVSVEGIAVLLDKTINDEKRMVLAAGSGLIEIDEHMAAILHYRLAHEVTSGKEALLDSDVDAPLRYDWPASIRNIIAVPLYSKERTISYSPINIPDSQAAAKSTSDACIIGLMVAFNRIDKPDFDSTDVKLFNSVANSCAVFIENGRLVRDLKELFIGSLKALTRSIDAKDPYTRGHSERVAFISKWIAEKVALQEHLEPEQIHKIYLAGLLHDIGKVGIDDIVLRKNGKLTDDELGDIKKHPSIGAGILSGIKQMRDIVPGVLTHHEHIDGSGYPNGLKGDQIPLMGKIICLADSFDAMTSKRTYRDAMTLEEALEEIRKQLGTQFDEKLGTLFITSDIDQLWDNIQNGLGEVYGDVSFSEYGTAAVGTLIR